MSRTRFRVNLHSTVLELLARNIIAISEVKVYSNFTEILPFKNSSNKFPLLCCRLLDFFNKNMLRQRGLDKYFLREILASVNFFLLVSKY